MEILGKSLLLCLFQFLETACTLLGSWFHLQSQEWGIGQPLLLCFDCRIALSPLPLLPSSSKDPCHDSGPTQIIQNKFPIRKPLTSSHLPSPFYHMRYSVQGLSGPGRGHLWGEGIILSTISTYHTHLLSTLDSHAET